MEDFVYYTALTFIGAAIVGVIVLIVLTVQHAVSN